MENKLALKITLKNTIRGKIKESLKEIFGEEGMASLSVKMEYPPDLKMGDYATPVALECAKILKKSPREIASKLKENLLESSNQDSYFEKIEIAGPGFINIFLSPSFLYDELGEIVNSPLDYGKGVLADQEKDSILLEYVSANPTGPLNVVSARAASLGSSLYNLWQYAGVKVSSEYYVNDFGNQVLLLAKSVAIRLLQKKQPEIEFPEDGYHGEYIYDVLLHCEKVKEHELSGRAWGLDDVDELKVLFLKPSLEYIIGEQKKDLLNFGIEFDFWYSEKKLHEEKKPEEAFSLLEKSGSIYDENGKKVFRSTDFGDDKDRVLIRDDGRPAYFMADIAYHLDKLHRGFSKLVNIWGPDHHGYISRLQGALEALEYSKDTLDVLIAQQVNLVDKGEIVKMSKRKGKFTTLRELMEEIPKDVARYFFIMRAADSPLDFDIELAKSQTMDNPVYYIQYAHARICSVLRENEKGDKVKPGKGTPDFWKEASRRNLMLWLLRYPDEIMEISQNYEIHRFAAFLKDLAGQFQRFYQRKENRIIGGDPSLAPALLELMVATKSVIASGLSILGVSAPESM